MHNWEQAVRNSFDMRDFHACKNDILAEIISLMHISSRVLLTQ
jgi:hypothetical protein